MQILIEIDPSLLVSLVSLLIAILTSVYLLGYKLGSIRRDIDHLEDAIGRFNAQFSPDWHKEYGIVLGQVRQLSDVNFEQIVRDLISRIHSSLQEVAQSVLQSLSVKIKRMEIYEDSMTPEGEGFREIKAISEIRPLSRIGVTLDCEVEKRYRILMVALFYVKKDGFVVPATSDITEITYLDHSIIPEIRSNKEASAYRRRLVEQTKGYMESMMPVLASVLTFLFKRKKG